MRFVAQLTRCNCFGLFQSVSRKMCVMHLVLLLVVHWPHTHIADRHRHASLFHHPPHPLYCSDAAAAATHRRRITHLSHTSIAQHTNRPTDAHAHVARTQKSLRTAARFMLCAPVDLICCGLRVYLLVYVLTYVCARVHDACLRIAAIYIIILYIMLVTGAFAVCVNTFYI